MSVLKEEWKDIPGFEGLYQASALGRIKAVEGKVTYSARHGKRIWKERILKYRGMPKHGHRVALYKNKQCYDFSVARLIGMTFLGVPEDEKMTINHMDGNRLNNRIENLEWLSLRDNVRHAFENDLMSSAKKIILYDNGKKKEFYSMAAASRHLGKVNGYVSNQIKRGRTLRGRDGRAVLYQLKEGRA